MEAQFGLIPGVVRTRVGYAGGTKQNPTYRDMGDHTETVQVDYDPRQISYEQLLAVFWESHAPGSRTWSRQYMKAVFYHDEQQHRRAEASKAALAERLGKKVRTQIVPLRSFTMAEDYHQKYLLKGQTKLADAMRRYYPAEKVFVDSTAVARLNGYAGGQGNAKQLAKEIDQLGLTPDEQRLLQDLVSGSGRLMLY